MGLARELLHRSGALRVSVAVDRPAPAVVECARRRAVVVHENGTRRELPHDWAADVELPPLPAMRRLPPLDADPDTGQVVGPLGGLEMLGRTVREVASLVGGRSVVTAEYETTRPEVPLGLAGRAGEPVVVLLGDAEFVLEV